MHRVERGETLAAIARMYGSAPSAISAANNNIINAPEAGDLLIIPAAYHERSAAVKRTSRSNIKSRGVAGVSSKRKRGTAANGQPVPSQILHHRASSPRLKTAAVRSAAVVR
jgi:hypothetical protein